ncbi:MAG: hypothetical protein ABIH25_04035 [Candidatus Woesearchaeota archaeon]
MLERYAELKLYFGLCSGGCVGEGILNKDKIHEYSRRRYNLAMQRVIESVDRAAEGAEWVPLEYGSFRLVKNEIEAGKLLEYIKGYIPESNLIIELCDSAHGMIKFFRKIRFDNAREDDRRKLIDIVNSSNMTTMIINQMGFVDDYLFSGKVLEFF